jgi:hypothetical protein
MATHKTKPRGMVAVRTHDGDITKVEYSYPPSPGTGKHYRRYKDRGRNIIKGRRAA